jgi:hypothetical protein
MEQGKMNSVATETIPTESPFYQETADADTSFPMLIPILNERESELVTSTFREERFCNSFSSKSIEQPTGSLIDFLYCQFKKAEFSQNAPEYLSFLLHNALLKTQLENTTAPLKILSLKRLRRFVLSWLNKKTNNNNDLSTSRTSVIELSQIQSKVDIIFQLCEVYDAPAVQQYILEIPELIDVIEVGLIKATEIFGSFSRYSLELIQDPESNKSQKLFAYISVSQPIEEALGLLEIFDSEWYLNQKDEILDLIAFNINPVNK